MACECSFLRTNLLNATSIEQVFRQRKLVVGFRSLQLCVRSAWRLWPVMTPKGRPAILWEADGP